LGKLAKAHRLGEVLVQALIFLVMTICLHEYAHIQMLHLLGGDGYVKYTFFSGYTKVTVIPSYEHWHILTALAGGGIVVLVYYTLDGMILEADTSIALRLVIGHQLPYAIMEGLGLNLLPICSVVIAFGMILAFIWCIPLFNKMLGW